MIIPGLAAVPDRSIISVRGEDRFVFLQGLVTNDVFRLQKEPSIYAMFLSPQGRFLHDFIITADENTLYLQVEKTRREDLLRKLLMFRLRARVEIYDEDGRFNIFSFTGPMENLPENLRVFAFLDPRHRDAGVRLVVPSGMNLLLQVDENINYDLFRIGLGFPEGSRDMTPGTSVPMEFGLDELNGVAWEKGCYLGQELTARSKFVGMVRKGLFPARFHGNVPDFDAPIQVGGEKAGKVLSSCDNLVLCLLYFSAANYYFGGETESFDYPGGTLFPFHPVWRPKVPVISR